MFTHWIQLKDVLDQAIEVDGLMLEATVRVYIRKDHNGNFEIDSLECDDIYMPNPTYDLIPLDKTFLSSTRMGVLLRKRFINAVELIALQKASLIPEYQWQEIDGEASA